MLQVATSGPLVPRRAAGLFLCARAGLGQGGEPHLAGSGLTALHCPVDCHLLGPREGGREWREGSPSRLGRVLRLKDLEHVSPHCGGSNRCLSRSNLGSYPQEAHRSFIRRLAPELFALSSRTDLWIKFSRSVSICAATNTPPCKQSWLAELAGTCVQAEGPAPLPARAD